MYKNSYDAKVNYEYLNIEIYTNTKSLHRHMEDNMLLISLGIEVGRDRATVKRGIDRAWFFANRDS